MYLNDVLRVESVQKSASGASFRQTGDFARHDLILSHLIIHLTSLLSLSLTSYNLTQYTFANMTGRAAGKCNRFGSNRRTQHMMLEAAALVVVVVDGYFDFQTHLAHRPIEMEIEIGPCVPPLERVSFHMIDAHLTWLSLLLLYFAQSCRPFSILQGGHHRRCRTSSS